MVPCSTYIPVVVDGLDDVRVLFFKGPDDRAGIISRTILPDHDLKRKAGFLHQYPFEALANVFFMVIGDDAN
jgi:hypothetical protein